MPAPVPARERPPFSIGRRAPVRRGTRAKDLADKGDESACFRQEASFESSPQSWKIRVRPALAGAVQEQVQAQRLLLVEELLQRKDDEHEQERSHWQQEVRELRQQLLFRKQLPFDPLHTNPPPTSIVEESFLSPSSPRRESEKECNDPCKTDSGHLNYLPCMLGTITNSRESGTGPEDLWHEDLREQGGAHCFCVPLGIPSYGAFDYYNWADKHSLRCQKKQFEMASRAAAETVCMYKRQSQKLEEIAEWRTGQEPHWLCNLTPEAQVARDPKEMIAKEKPTAKVEILSSLKELATAGARKHPRPYRSDPGRESPMENVKLHFDEERAAPKVRERKEGFEAEGKFTETSDLPVLSSLPTQGINESFLTETAEKAIEKFSYSQRRLIEKAQKARAVGEATGKVKQWTADIQRKHVDGSNLSPWNRMREDRFRAEDMPNSRSRVIHEQNITRMKMNAEKRRKKKETEESTQFWRRFVKYC